jgi:hypothetical protein
MIRDYLTGTDSEKKNGSGQAEAHFQHLRERTKKHHENFNQGRR